jgi:nucleoside-diphosphate-sugar epimerase
MVFLKLCDVRRRVAVVIYLIGGRGFVGSAYARLLDRLGMPFKVVTHDNMDALRGTSCDILINASGNSRKPLATSEPLTDFELSVHSVAKTAEAFSAEIYVQLSSGDVYPDQSRPELTREDQAIDPGRQSRYGLHKRLAEEIVQATQQKWLVVRMGGLVGPGLKKNAIFDMMTGAPVWLSPQSELQFISTDMAAQIVWELVRAGVRREIVNLGGSGLVNLGKLHRRIGSKSRFLADAPTIRYELALDKLASLSSKPVPDANAEVDGFLASRAGKAEVR